ncbi:MAG: HAD family hydrolase [Mycobacteriales bacterium]
MRRTDLKALLLDLDGTLLDHRAAASAGIRSWLATLLPVVPLDLVERWAALEEHHVSRAERGEVTWQEQRRHRLAELFAAVGLPAGTDDELDAHFADFLTHYEQAWTAYDDVEEGFATWRAAGVRVAVLTNGVNSQQRRKLAAIGVLDDVEFVVALDDLGVGKPDPRMYAEACARFGLPAGEVVYVGDDVVRDAVGAHRAGLVGVWLDRFGLPTPPGVDRVVRGLHEVLPLLSTD